MKYGVAIVYYNPDETVLQQLKIYRAIFKHILIVDNSEYKNDVIDEVETMSGIVYISNGGNKGMSVALSMAFRWAHDIGLDYILTMDQDSIYSYENINKMISYIDANYSLDVGIYVANFAKLYFDKKRNEMVAGEYRIKTTEVENVEMCLTSSSFVNVNAIQNILPLDDYFIGYVDNFISTDLIKCGYRLVRVGCSCFEQQVGERVVNNWWNRHLKILHHNEKRYYYMVRNNYYYREKFKYDKNIRKRSWLLLYRLYFNIIFGENDKLKKFLACIRGYSDYKKGVLGIMPE